MRREQLGLHQHYKVAGRERAREKRRGENQKSKGMKEETIGVKRVSNQLEL